ncbi:hypothetical protein ACWDUM_26155 [Rhodococcus sp. NPDC003322]
MSSRLLDPTAVTADGTFTRDDVATPSTAEDTVAQELSQNWPHPQSGRSPHSGETEALFPWTSRRRSCPPTPAEPVKQRRSKLDASTPKQAAELTALNTLDELNAVICMRREVNCFSFVVSFVTLATAMIIS